MIRILVTAIISFFMLVHAIPSACCAHESRTVFVLFDLSGSTASHETRREYLENFRRIVDIRGPREDFYSSSLCPGDVLMADIISGNSIAESTFPIQGKLREFSFWKDSRLRYAKYFRDTKQGLIKDAKGLLLHQKRNINSTDMLSAIRVAERVFKLYRRDKSILVIMSDMIEESKDYNFAAMRLNDASVSKIIAREKARGLPDLSGVTVYVSGCNASSRNRFMAIRNFWIKYFNECGAQLENRNYGRAFPEFGDVID